MTNGEKAGTSARAARRVPVLLGLLLVAGLALIWFARPDDGQARKLEAVRYIEHEIAMQNRLLEHGFSRYDVHDVSVEGGTATRIGGHYVSCATARSKEGADKRARPALVADTTPIVARPKEQPSFAWLREQLKCPAPTEAASES